MSAYLKRMLRYDVWANEATLGSLTQGPPPPRSLRWMSHILGAELLWLSRMEGVPSKLPVWPELTVEQCQAHLSELSSELDPLKNSTLAIPSKSEAVAVIEIVAGAR